MQAISPPPTHQTHDLCLMTLGTASLESVTKGIALTQRFSCFKGCAHCCHYPVSVTLLEGVTLFKSIPSNIWAAIRDKVKVAAKVAEETSWEVAALAYTPCVLLSPENTCIAYAHRPLQCRLTMTAKDPWSCHPHRLTEDHFLQIAPDVYASQLNRANRLAGFPTGSAPLPSVLLQAEALCRDV